MRSTKAQCVPNSSIHYFLHDKAITFTLLVLVSSRGENSSHGRSVQTGVRAVRVVGIYCDDPLLIPTHRWFIFYSRSTKVPSCTLAY